jgi:hypothetical protein
MSVSKSKCSYSNYCLHFTKRAVPLIIFFLNMKQEYKKVIELRLQEITIRSDNKFTMQCYNTFTELGCHVIIILKFLVIRYLIEALVIFKRIICNRIKYRDSSFHNRFSNC